MSGNFPNLPVFDYVWTGNERMPVDTVASGGAPPQSGYVTFAQIVDAIATATGGTVNPFPDVSGSQGAGTLTNGLPALSGLSDDYRIVLDLVLAEGEPPQSVYVTWADLSTAIQAAL